MHRDDDENSVRAAARDRGSARHGDSRRLPVGGDLRSWPSRPKLATFATPGVRIGLFCSTPMVAVSRVLGRKRALEMLLTGDAIDARTAAEWGLVNRVVPQTELRAATLALARAHRPSQRVHPEDRQAGVLPPSRFAASRGLRLHATGDDRKRPRRRRPGRHLRVSREAPTPLARPLVKVPLLTVAVPWVPSSWHRTATQGSGILTQSCFERYFPAPAPGSRSRACGTSEFSRSAWWGTTRQNESIRES